MVPRRLIVFLQYHKYHPLYYQHQLVVKIKLAGLAMDDYCYEEQQEQKIVVQDQ